MLFGYPARANADNWLHVCLKKIVAIIHQDVDAGVNPPVWPDIIPQKYRPLLESRTSIEDRLINYKDALVALKQAERHQIQQCSQQQNQLSQLLSGQATCDTVVSLPPSIREPLTDLFITAFELLSEVDARDGISKLRDKHYKIIYATIEDKVCPFCGLTKLYPPGAAREEYDHYLLKTVYPFVAANLWNLVPMCHKCNSTHKRTSDLLQLGGVRRTAFNPYHHGEIQVALTQSTPFGGSKKSLPRWQIDFLPSSPEVDTWDSVFSIRQRYSDYVLDVEYYTWIGVFAQFCLQRNPIPIDADSFVAAFDAYLLTLRKERLNNLAFLKAAVVEMLRSHCLQGNSRVIRVLKTSVEELVKFSAAIMPTSQSSRA